MERSGSPERARAYIREMVERLHALSAVTLGVGLLVTAATAGCAACHGKAGSSSATADASAAPDASQPDASTAALPTSLPWASVLVAHALTQSVAIGRVKGDGRQRRQARARRRVGDRGDLPDPLPDAPAHVRRVSGVLFVRSVPEISEAGPSGPIFRHETSAAETSRVSFILRKHPRGDQRVVTLTG